jgi:hypothetical protein
MLSKAGFLALLLLACSCQARPVHLGRALTECVSEGTATAIVSTYDGASAKVRLVPHALCTDFEVWSTGPGRHHAASCAGCMHDTTASTKQLAVVNAMQAVQDAFAQCNALPAGASCDGIAQASATVSCGEGLGSQQPWCPVRKLRTNLSPHVPWSFCRACHDACTCNSTYALALSLFSIAVLIFDIDTTPPGRHSSPKAQCNGPVPTGPMAFMQAVAQAVVDAVTKVTGRVSGGGKLCAKSITCILTVGVDAMACRRKAQG